MAAPFCPRPDQPRVSPTPPLNSRAASVSSLTRAPSSGVALLQGLMLLERTDIASRGPNDPIAWVELAQAERLIALQNPAAGRAPQCIRN